jgi:hypothetical protein
MMSDAFISLPHITKQTWSFPTIHTHTYPCLHHKHRFPLFSTQNNQPQAILLMFEFRTMSGDDSNNSTITKKTRRSGVFSDSMTQDSATPASSSTAVQPDTTIVVDSDVTMLPSPTPTQDVTASSSQSSTTTSSFNTTPPTASPSSPSQSGLNSAGGTTTPSFASIAAFNPSDRKRKSSSSSSSSPSDSLDDLDELYQMSKLDDQIKRETFTRRITLSVERFPAGTQFTKDALELISQDNVVHHFAQEFGAVNSEQTNVLPMGDKAILILVAFESQESFAKSANYDGIYGTAQQQDAPLTSSQAALKRAYLITDNLVANPPSITEVTQILVEKLKVAFPNKSIQAPTVRKSQNNQYLVCSLPTSSIP